MIPKAIKKFLLNKRLPPLFTIILAPIAFALSIVAVLSRGDNGMRQHFVVSLNTSTLLQNVLKVEAAPSVTARGLGPLITTPPALDERQLPKLGDVKTFFESVGSKISTAIIPSETGTTGGLLGGGSSGDDGGGLGNLFGENGTLGNLFNGNGSFSDIFKSGPLGDLFNNIGGQAAVGIVSLVNSVAASAMEGFGLADQYSIYMREYCSANLTVGTKEMGPQSCSALRDISIEPSNSTLQVGNMMVDFSALNIPNKLSGAGGVIKALFDAIFAFQIIGIVATGLLLLISPPLIFSRFQRAVPRAIAGGLASLASIFLVLVTAIEVIIAVAIPAVVNPLGEGLGVDAKRSSSFVVLVVVSSIFMEMLAVIWVTHLIVTWHDSTYVRKDAKDQDFVSPTSSGRPIIKLNGPDVLPLREKVASPGEVPRQYARFRAKSPLSSSGRPVSGVAPEDQLPPERLYSPRQAPQQYKPYRPSDRLTIG